MSSKKQQVEIKFEKERETKNTVRFAEVIEENEPTIGTLYVQKHTLAELGNPESLVVTIAGR